MSTFEPVTTPQSSESPQRPERDGLGTEVLLHNAVWFTRLRWLVVAAFVAAGLTGMVEPGLYRNLGILAPGRWPWLLAAMLFGANALFSLLVGRLDARSSQRAIRANMWLQIVVDVGVLTILVHVVGSTTTFVPFAFLFHIALACIFFPPSESLLVTILAAALYMGCVTLETLGVLPAGGAGAGASTMPHASALLNMSFGASAVFIWFIVWYLVSSLSADVRRRDRELQTANDRLMKADHEKTLQVLRTTHELKAPFSGIESNIQLLRFQHWNELPEPARAIVERIEQRSRSLRERINEILTLGELKSKSTGAGAVASVSLQTVVQAAVEEVREKARERRVGIDVAEGLPAVIGEEKQLVILFSNLLANAVLYSHEGGGVVVRASEGPNGDVSVSVRDRGIGIDAQSLPHIFEEYYRSAEGARFNRLSTGLGLALVKEIARSLGLRIRVESEVGSGTTFTITFTSSKDHGAKEEASCHASPSLMTTRD